MVCPQVWRTEVIPTLAPNHLGSLHNSKIDSEVALNKIL